MVVWVKKQFLVLSIEGLSWGHRESKGAWPLVKPHLTQTSLAGLERGRDRVQVGGQVGGIQTVVHRSSPVL